MSSAFPNPPPASDAFPIARTGPMTDEQKAEAKEKNPFGSGARRAHIKRQELPADFQKPGTKFRSEQIPLTDLLTDKNERDNITAKATADAERAQQELLSEALSDRKAASQRAKEQQQPRP